MKVGCFFALCLVSLLAATTDAQFPYMDGFMSGFSQGMNNMFRNLGNMMGTMQTNLGQMGQQMSQTYARQAARAEAYARDLPPGQGRQVNDGNVRGYVFRNQDGTLSYSLSSGGPGSSGFVYHSGPDGTYQQQW